MDLRAGDTSAGSEKRLVGLKKSLDRFEILAGSEDILAGSGQVFKSVKVGGKRERMELALNMYCDNTRRYGMITPQFNHVVSPAWKGETLHQVEGTNQKLY